MLRALVAFAAAALSGCMGVAPVVRYPYVEARDLSLRRELLRIRVTELGMEVVADFEFVGEVARGRVMTFPIGAPGGPAQGFAATLGTAAAARPVRSRHGSPGALPAGRAVEQYDLEIPEGRGRAGRLPLRVRYLQATRNTWSYVLMTGAYWKGPIQTLTVEVTDPSSRLRGATVEGQPAHTRTEGRLHWQFTRIEPRAGVLLVLR